MLWVTDPNGQCIFVTRAWLSFRGRSMEQELGRGWLDGVHEEDRQRCAEQCTAARDTRAHFSIEYRVRRADGMYRWISCNGQPLLSAEGIYQGQVGSCVDITEQKHPAPEGVQAERRLLSLIENARDMVYRTRVFPTHVVEYVGGAVQSITGRTPAEFYANPRLPLASVHPDDAGLLRTTLEEPARLQTTVTLRWIHPDGRVVWAEHRRVPVYDSAGQLIAIEGIARDITSVVENQQRLSESEEQMRQLAARLQTAREEERAQVARDLHDGLGQTLTALKLEIGRAMAALNAERLTPTVVDRLQSLMGLSEIGLATVKRIATDLRPPTLDHLGLAEAIRWEALTFKARSGLRCHVRANKQGTALSAEQQTALFRIFQEALTNIVRHARASAVTVTLTERANECELRIRDNGRGITEVEANDPRAIGLLGMRERAALVGGAFRVVGYRGKGTVITVQIPITQSARRPHRPAHSRKAERKSHDPHPPRR